MRKYFITTTDVGHYLVDKYNSTIQPHREKTIGPFLDESGALGVYMRRDFGQPSTIRALVFPADHEICSVEGAVITDHPSGVVVSFGDDAPFAPMYYGAIAYVNEQLIGHPEFSDWLHHEVNVTRYALDMKSHLPLMTSSNLLPDGRIVFTVPAGNEGQSELKPDKRLKEISAEEYQAIVAEVSA